MATPPRATIIETPPTPRFAGETSRHYTTRKRTRHSAASSSPRAADTPPPDSDQPHPSKSTTSANNPSAHSSAVPPQSPPSSAHTSPRKGTAKSNRRTGSHRMEDNDGQTSEPHISHSSKGESEAPPKPAGMNASNLLPTPASLPRKKDVPRREVDAAARFLFPSRPDNVDDAMPTPRKNKRGRRHVGFSLYNQSDEEPEDPDIVKIYTDSRDKVPEIDPNEDNPFIDRPQQHWSASPSSHGRRGKKRKQHVESHPQIKHAFNRDEGMVYTFRGKKVYRQFPRDSDSDREDSPTALGPDGETMNDPALTNLRPLTRSSIKPRLLFPPNEPTVGQSAVDAGNHTRIAEGGLHGDPKTATPERSLFRPASPPPTGRAVQPTMQKPNHAGNNMQDHAMQDAQIDPPMARKKKRSPFDGWARTKAGLTPPKGKKRDAREMDEAGVDDTKRVRSGVS